MALFESLKETIAITIADAIGKYHKGFFSKRVLKTTDEVVANTNVKNLPSAVVVGELINDLTFPDGTKFYPDMKNGKYGFNTIPSRGADTFIPFLNSKPIYIRAYGYPDDSRSGFVFTCLQISDDNSNWKTVASISHKIEVTRTTSVYTLQTIV